MKNNVTELVFILDKSGSMAGMEKDSIGGFNAMIEEQKAFDGKVYVSTFLFSNHYEIVHDRVGIDEVSLLTEKDFRVGGCTALLDAIGKAITHIENIHKYLRKEDVPMQTLFIITTDGMENASRIYNYKQIKKMIQQKEECGWQFLFAAANIDVNDLAENVGVSKENVTDYCVDDTKAFYGEICDVIHCYRDTGAIPKNWADKISKNKR